MKTSKTNYILGRRSETVFRTVCKRKEILQILSNFFQQRPEIKDLIPIIINKIKVGLPEKPSRIRVKHPMKSQEICTYTQLKNFRKIIVFDETPEEKVRFDFHKIYCFDVETFCMTPAIFQSPNVEIQHVVRRGGRVEFSVKLDSKLDALIALIEEKLTSIIDRKKEIDKGVNYLPAGRTAGNNYCIQTLHMSIPVFIKNQKILLQKAIEKDYFKHGNKIRFNFLLTGMSQSKEYIYISNGDKSVYHIFRINAINIENIVVENLQGCLVSEE